MATEGDNNSYKALKARKQQACEFCDQVFNNRFSSIVHNSSHIIIPLLKYHIHYCDICCLYSTSTEDFNAHMNDKHPPVKSNDNNDIKLDIKVPEIKLEKLPRLNRDDIFEVKQEIFDVDEDDSLPSDKPLCQISEQSAERNCITNEFENEEEYTDSIKSKLKFEVDHEYGDLLKDFTSDCEVQIQYKWTNKNEDISTYIKNKNGIKNNIVYEEPVDEFKFNNLVVPNVPSKCEKYESVHYADLMSLGVFVCKCCSLAFSNRFSLIVHETTHIRINKVLKRYPQCPQCDRYVGKNPTAVVNRMESKKREILTCEKCSFLHTNYHSNVSEPLKSSTNQIKNLIMQKPVQNSEWFEKFSIIKACDRCCSFFKNTFKKEYILKDTVSDITARPCHECKNLFFKLKTVKTITRVHRSRINDVYSPSRYTNEKRLKNIQIRLKMFNKLGKFYGDLLLTFLTIATCTCLNNIAGPYRI